MVTHSVDVIIKTWRDMSLKQTGNILFLNLDSIDLDLFCCIFNFTFRLYTLICIYEIFNNSFKERKVKQTCLKSFNNINLCLKSFNNIDLISGLQIFGTCPSLWKKGSGMMQRKECYIANQEMWGLEWSESLKQTCYMTLSKWFFTVFLVCEMKEIKHVDF